MGLKLTQLAAKPQLVKITVDDEATKEKYGDELEFWILDRQPLEKFIKIATGLSNDYAGSVNLLSELILDEDGKPVLTEDKILPNDLNTKVIQKIVEVLGK
jgi:hypothetical protein